MDGIIVINKPEGYTSFDVIAKLRRILNMKKLGHAGTLDPDATGVLPVCAGKATKVIEFLMEKDKTYRTILRLGIETDTQDASGNILAMSPVEVTDDEVKKTVSAFVGSYQQLPPMYSAIRIGGKRLYELARQGIEIEREPRLITIYAIDGISISRKDNAVRVCFEVSCSKGTYIRTLCADIGKKLGCGGHMESLIRTRSGPFRLEDAITLEELEAHKVMGEHEKLLIGMDRALETMSSLTVNDEQKLKLRNGLKIGLEPNQESVPGAYVRIYHEDGKFLAIGQWIKDNEALLMKSYKWLES